MRRILHIWNEWFLGDQILTSLNQMQINVYQFSEAYILIFLSHCSNEPTNLQNKKRIKYLFPPLHSSLCLCVCVHVCRSVRVCVLPCSSEAIKAVATLLEQSRTAWLIWNFPSGIQPRTTAATAARNPTTVAWTCSSRTTIGALPQKNKQRLRAVDGWHEGRLNTQFLYPGHHDQLEFGSASTDVTAQHKQLTGHWRDLLFN